MNSTGKLILKLSFLVIPWSILVFLLFNDVIDNNIGGGYDLSGLV